MAHIMYNGVRWDTLHPRAGDLVGHLPEFLSVADPRPAKEQFDMAYAHGGGWHPMKGWAMPDTLTGRLKYPGDPAYVAVARAELRDEVIFVYEHAWVSIVQKDGTFEVARMD